MLKVEITDDFMYDLFARIEANDKDILGYGSNRIAMVYNDFLIIKMSLWREVTNEENKTIDDIMKWNENATLFEKHNRKFVIYSEKQTKKELEIISMIPNYLIRRYAAEVIMFGEWNGHYITFCERLEAVEVDGDIQFDMNRVEADTSDMLHSMTNDLQDYHIKICDIHGGNLGYDKQGNIRFIDLGFWKEYDFFVIDWDCFYEWQKDFLPSSSNYSDSYNY